MPPKNVKKRKYKKPVVAPRKSAPATDCRRKVPPADGTVDVIVKLGGAAITVKDGEPDTPNLDALKTCCWEIANAVNTHGRTTSPRDYDEQYLKVIIVHGAGSFGHPQAKEYGVANGGDVDGNARLKEGIEKTKTSVRKLCKLVCDELSKENGYQWADGTGSIAPERVAPISPYGNFFTVGKKLNRNLSRGGFDEVRAAVMAGKVPVLHGDVVRDSEQGCAILSGDTLVECLTEEFKPKRVVFISDVEGIFTSKPLHKNGPCDICPDGTTPPPALLREIQVKPDGSWVATKAAGPLRYISNIPGRYRRHADPEWVDANPEWVFNEALDKLVVKAAVGTTDATVSLEDNGDVTGGIKTKVQEAAAIALKGVDVFLTHVTEMNRYGDAILKGDADEDDDDYSYTFTHVMMAPGAPEVKTEVKVEPP